VLEDSSLNDSWTWSEDTDEDCGQRNCVLEDAMLVGAFLTFSRGRFAALRKSFAFDKAENKRFLPLVHDR
jgi:hypothetical protein